LRQAILLLVKGNAPQKHDLVQYLGSKGIEATASTIDLDIPHVRDVCGALVKFAASDWNGSRSIGELEFGNAGNGGDKEYSGIKEWFRKEGGPAIRSMMKQVWKPPVEEKRESAQAE
jgi:hypothetical protein